VSSPSAIAWNLDLINRYDLAGPRYTSYPTALQFDQELTPQSLITTGQTTADKSAPLSLYVHIPFCAHVCYYCACNKVITRNRDRAEPYLDTLFKEIDQMAALYGENRLVDQLHWGGGTPTFISDDQMEALMNKLRQAFRLRDDDEGDYSIEIDPREVTFDTLARLRKIGFNRISLGIQDVDPVVQKAVNREQSTESVQAILDEARRLGFRSINMDLIYGLPHQDLERFDKTLATVIKMSPDRLSVFNYAHMPERFRPQRRIDAEALPSPSEKLRILQSTINTLLAAGYVYIGMDHFAKPDDELAKAQREGHLHRNFQGYTTHAQCDLVAMGVSAISQIGDVYYQNEHEVDAWANAVETRGHAIRRGVTLHQDDHIRRHVITELICHFKLDIQHVEQQFGMCFKDYFFDAEEELARFEADKLITRSPEKLFVTPAGRLLIRRICMAFDAYIPKAQKVQSFSRII
jgi:oxygen-independent coproporphyrinogen-3 oxidase